MSSISLSLLVGLFLGATSATDPIDTWVAQLSADPLWENGSSPILDLPENASTEVVVAKLFERTEASLWARGDKILEVKKVHIKGSLPDLYTAVLVKSGLEKKVVLIRYRGDWWSRVLDVP